MAAVVYLDTHVVFWLYAAGADAPLSTQAREAIQKTDEVRKVSDFRPRNADLTGFENL